MSETKKSAGSAAEAKPASKSAGSAAEAKPASKSAGSAAEAKSASKSAGSAAEAKPASKSAGSAAPIDDAALRLIEKAAEKGARKGAARGGSILKIVSLILNVILILGILYFADTQFNLFGSKVSSFFESCLGADEHDMVLRNNSFAGYTAVDFEEAVLGQSQRLKKLEVYTQQVTDVTTMTKAGLLKLSVFSQSQQVKYTGTAVYTVDLSQIGSGDISYDKDSGTVTLTIPHAVMEEINIGDNIEIIDSTKGLLAFGKINLTVEEQSAIRSGVREHMEAKLIEENTSENADRFASLSVWEIYSPIIRSVYKYCSLKVVFDD